MLLAYMSIEPGDVKSINQIAEVLEIEPSEVHEGLSALMSYGFDIRLDDQTQIVKWSHPFSESGSTLLSPAQLRTAEEKSKKWVRELRSHSIRNEILAFLRSPMPSHNPREPRP